MFVVLCEMLVFCVTLRACAGCRAERHGMPKKLAENPKDKQKVKDIIARMKADLMVEKIKAQFKHDDDSVGGIIHSADPAAATKGI